MPRPPCSADTTGGGREGCRRQSVGREGQAQGVLWRPASSVRLGGIAACHTFREVHGREETQHRGISRGRRAWPASRPAAAAAPPHGAGPFVFAGSCRSCRWGSTPHTHLSSCSVQAMGSPWFAKLRLSSWPSHQPLRPNLQRAERPAGGRVRCRGMHVGSGGGAALQQRNPFAMLHGQPPGCSKRGPCCPCARSPCQHAQAFAYAEAATPVGEEGTRRQLRGQHALHLQAGKEGGRGGTRGFILGGVVPKATGADSRPEDTQACRQDASLAAPAVHAEPALGAEVGRRQYNPTSLPGRLSTAGSTCMCACTHTCTACRRRTGPGSTWASPEPGV